jgi:hypothetical protein
MIPAERARAVERAPVPSGTAGPIAAAVERNARDAG